MPYKVSYLINITGNYRKQLRDYIKLNGQFISSVDKMKKTSAKFGVTASQVASRVGGMGTEINGVVPALNRAALAGGKFNKSAKNSTKSIQNASAATRNWGRQLANMQTAFLAVAMTKMFQAPLKEAIAYESGMIDVARVADISKKELAVLSVQIKKTAADLGMLPTGMEEIVYQGSKLGISVNEMNQFMQIAGQTITAFDYNLKGGGGAEKAVSTIARVKDWMSLSMAETKDMMDAVNFLVDKTSATADKTMAIIGRTAGILKGIKMPHKEVAAWAAFAGRIMPTKALGASGIRQFVTQLQLMPGMEAKMIKDPTKVMRQTLMDLRNLPEETRGGQIVKMFGKHAAFFIKTAIGHVGKLDQGLKLVAKNSGYASSMVRELMVKLKGTASVTDQVKMAFKVFQIELGTGFLPVIKLIGPLLKDMLLTFAGFLREHPFIAFLVSAFLGLAASALVLLPVIGMVAMGVKALVLAFGYLTWSTGLVGLAIVAVIGFLYLFEKYGWPVALVAGVLAVAFLTLALSLGWLTAPVVIATLAIIALVAILYIAYKLVEAIGEAFGWWGDDKKIEVAHTQEQGQSPVAKVFQANNKNTLTGNIKVAAEPGSRVTESNFDSDPWGALGEMGTA